MKLSDATLALISTAIDSRDAATEKADAERQAAADAALAAMKDDEAKAVALAAAQLAVADAHAAIDALTAELSNPPATPAASKAA